MRLKLTYRRCHLGLHAIAYALMLVPFILLLLLAFQPPAQIPIFSMSTGNTTVLIGARGICLRKVGAMPATCIKRAFGDYDGAVPLPALNQTKMTLQLVNSPLLIGVLLVSGLGVGLAAQSVLILLPSSPFRRLHPFWRALSMKPSTILLVVISIWTLIIALVSIFELERLRKHLTEAPKVGAKNGSVKREVGWALALSAVITAFVALLWTVLLVIFWDENRERKDAKVKAKKIVQLGDHFIVVEEQSTGGDDDDDSMDSTQGSTSKKKKDIPVGKAIEIVRKELAHGPNPPKVATEFHPEDEEDEPTEALDGGPLPTYVDPAGQHHREMISSELAMSPTEDKDMPTPKQLRADQHVQSAPVWQNKKPPKGAKENPITIGTTDTSQAPRSTPASDGDLGSLQPGVVSAEVAEEDWNDVGPGKTGTGSDPLQDASTDTQYSQDSASHTPPGPPPAGKQYAPPSTPPSPPRENPHLPMGQAIAVARQRFAHGANPPIIAHEFHPRDEDEPTAALDGGPLPTYVDEHGRRHREMIASELAQSPTEDKEMPAPKELRPEEHLPARPVWLHDKGDTVQASSANGGQIDPMVAEMLLRLAQQQDEDRPFEWQVEKQPAPQHHHHHHHRQHKRATPANPEASWGRQTQTPPLKLNTLDMDTLLQETEEPARGHRHR